MQYTLDSVVQVEQALQVLHPHNDIYRKPVIISGTEMAKIVENPQLVYFGVVTNPPGAVIKMSYRGNEIMTVDPGSQIIEAFTALSFENDLGDPVPGQGQFRGFSIQVQS